MKSLSNSFVAATMNANEKAYCPHATNFIPGDAMVLPTIETIRQRFMTFLLGSLAIYVILLSTRIKFQPTRGAYLA